MRRTRLGSLFFLLWSVGLGSLGLGGALVGVARGQAARLDALVTRARAEQGAQTGILVLDRDSGRVLYHHDALAMFAPASNMKVLTVAAALHRLGPDHVVETAFELHDGHLVVRGAGDAEMRTGGAGDPDRMFTEVVGALKLMGVDAVRSVRLDLDGFGGPIRPADWPANQLGRPYCPPTGGLVLEDGCVSVRLTPAGAGVRAIPLGAHAHVPVDGTVRVGKGVWGLRDDGDAIHLWGKVRRAGLPVEGSATVADPAAAFRRALEIAMRRGGVRIAADAPANSDPVHVQRTPWRATLQRALLDSSNFAAEQTLRILGHETLGDGSLAGGRRALRAALTDMVGEPDDAVRLEDGSGLSRTNRISPALLAATLREIAQGEHAAFFADALPLAGRTGSLEDRFLGSALVGQVQAKTGWIAGASSLSGYAPGPDGRVCVFAILMNYDRTASGRNKHLKKLQEQMCAAMGELR